MGKQHFLILGIAALIAFSSCHRKGCTDLDASNYSSKAKKSDGSCHYFGDGIIWFNQTKWQQFNDESMSTVHYFLDGAEIGFKEIISYTSTPPSCGSPNGLNITMDLGKSKSKTYTLTVKKANGTVLSTHALTIIANDCSPFQLPI